MVSAALQPRLGLDEVPPLTGRGYCGASEFESPRTLFRMTVTDDTAPVGPEVTNGMVRVNWPPVALDAAPLNQVRKAASSATCSEVVWRLALDVGAKVKVPRTMLRVVE